MNRFEMQFHVQERKLEFPYVDNLKRFLSALSDGRYILVVRKIRKSRSLPQNSYYWKIISIIAEEVGYDIQELHEHFKFRFLVSETRPQRVKSTTELNTSEMAVYVDQVIQFATENGITILSPEEFYALREAEEKARVPA
jgi:hypothetical protein